MKQYIVIRYDIPGTDYYMEVTPSKDSEFLECWLCNDDYTIKHYVERIFYTIEEVNESVFEEFTDEDFQCYIEDFERDINTLDSWINETQN